MSEIINTPTNQIVPGNNDRKVFNPVKLQELAASIEQNGLAQPITIRPIGGQTGLFGSSEGVFQIVAGERRFWAVSQVLGWETIPSIVRELTDEEASAIMLVENTGREDLNPIEEANAYQERIFRYGWSNEHIGKIAGVSAELVLRRVELLKLSPEIQDLVASDQLPIGHANALTDLDINRQRIAVRIFSESKNGLPLKNFRHIISQLLEEQSQESLFDLESFWVEQVQKGADLPKRGKRAITGAPTRNDLPNLETTGKDNVGSIFDRYISELTKNGFEAEAAAVGNLFNTLVHGNWASVPNTSNLLES